MKCINQHPLTPQRRNYVCDVCQARSNGPAAALTCMACDFDACPKHCVGLRQCLCPRKHPLFLVVEASHWVCDVCDASHGSHDLCAECSTCNYTECLSHQMAKVLTHPCPNGYRCRQIGSPVHCAFLSHGETLPPCREGVTCPHLGNRDHTAQYSHPCWYHSECREMGIPKHLRHFYHPGVPACPNGENCPLRSKFYHRLEFSHPGPLKVCREGFSCVDNSMRHRSRFLHPPTANAVGSVPTTLFGLNGQTSFHANMEFLNQKLRENGGAQLPVAAAAGEQGILADIRSHLPCHRCTSNTFEAIVEHGQLMSRSFQIGVVGEQRRMLQGNNGGARGSAGDNGQNSREAFRYFLAAATAHPVIRSVLRKANLSFDDISDAVVSWLQNRSQDDAASFVRQATETLAARGRGAERNSGVLNEAFSQLQALFALHKKHNVTGMQWHRDEIAGTHCNVFSVVGPHHDYQRYGNVLLVLDRAVLQHPDADMTAVAATSYFTGRVAMTLPWLADRAVPITTEAQMNEVKAITSAAYHRCKIHMCQPGWDTTLSKFYSRACAAAGQPFRDFWQKSDSHKAVEGHLPPLVSLEHVVKVVMLESEWQALSPSAKAQCQRLWGDNAASKNSAAADAVILLVDDVRQVEEAAREWVTSGSAVTPACGFSFSMSPTAKVERARLPILMPRSGHGFTVSVQFHSRGPWELVFGPALVPSEGGSDFGVPVRRQPTPIGGNLNPGDAISSGYVLSISVHNSCRPKREVRLAHVPSGRTLYRLDRVAPHQPCDQLAHYSICLRLKPNYCALDILDENHDKVCVASMPLDPEKVIAAANNKPWSFAVGAPTCTVRFEHLSVVPNAAPAVLNPLISVRRPLTAKPPK